MQIAFLGLGRMGGPIARRLIAAGHELTVNDLREESARTQIEMGARWAATPAQACANADLVLTCLPGPPQVEAAVFGPDGILQGCRPGTIYADLTTNSVSLVRRMHGAFAERGCPMLDSPISGGVTGAQNGTLQVMVGGDREVFERILPVLQVFGNKVTHVGAVGCGIVAKLAHGLAYIGSRSVLAECFTMGVKGGLDPDVLLEVMRGSALGQGLMLGHFMPEMVLKGSFEPVRFAMRLAHKDITLAASLARELDVPIPMGALTEQLMVEAMARGWGDRDYGTAFLLQEEKAGVQVRSKAAKA